MFPSLNGKDECADYQRAEAISQSPSGHEQYCGLCITDEKPSRNACLDNACVRQSRESPRWSTQTHTVEEEEKAGEEDINKRMELGDDELLD